MIEEYARRKARGVSQLEQAVSLFYAVRDDFRYDPYRIDLSPRGMDPQRVLESGYGWCVPKAALLSACCRALGIPARLGFADVRNHLNTPKMLQVMRTDVIVWHGFSEIFLQDRWVKATPAFNRDLCLKFGLTPLDFNGLDDSVFHEYDGGRQHMDYLRWHGSFDEIPMDRMMASYRETYPHWNLQALTGDFERDVSEL